MSTFNISELEGLYTERSMVNEATARATVRTDNYNTTIKQITPRVAEENSPYPGRKTVTLGLSFKDREGKEHTMMQDVSWMIYRELHVGGERLLVKPGDERYDTSLKLDKASRLWAQIEKVFNPAGEYSIQEVLQAALNSEVETYIMEGFVSEGGGMPRWIDAKEKAYGSYEEYVKAYDTKKEEYAKEGLIPKNFLVSIRKVKNG